MCRGGNPSLSWPAERSIVLYALQESSRGTKGFFTVLQFSIIVDSSVKNYIFCNKKVQRGIWVKSCHNHIKQLACRAQDGTDFAYPGKNCILI